MLLEHYFLFHSAYFISDLIATKFLMRLNHKLMISEICSGIFFFLIDTVLFKLQTFALKPKVCEMGGNSRCKID